MVEELNNKEIDKTLEDTKLENKREAKVKKSSKLQKKESRPKSETKTSKNHLKIFSNRRFSKNQILNDTTSN